MTQNQSALLDLLAELDTADEGSVMRRILAHGLQALIEAEATAVIGAGRHERTPERMTQRNGSRPKTVTTAAGDITVAIPKTRTGSFFPSLLEPRRRIDRALHAVICEAYVHGVSTAKFNLPLAELGIEVSKNPVSPLQVTAILRHVLEQLQTASQHVIALDGLDSFFFETEDEWSSLTGLLHAVVELNRFLRSTQIPATLVAAVRSDIFEVLPTAELNKAKAHVVHLDWSALGIGARNKLWELVGAKAAVGRPEVRELTRVYLNQPISIGPYTELAEYFLDYTRLLPRDLIALLTVAQEVHPGSSPVIQSEAR